MNTRDNADDNTENAPQSHRPRGVKRGAFPTPQSEIDKAPVFVPPDAENADRPQDEPDQPTADPDNDENR